MNDVFLSKRISVLASVAVAIIVKANAASACVTTWEKPEELKRQSEVVVQAVVTGTETARRTFRGIVYTYKVTVRAVEQGNLRGESLKFTYEDLLMHRRGDRAVCPLKHGSGIENDLKQGGHYRMYLRSASDTEILLAEEMPGQSLAAKRKDLSFIGTVTEIKASHLGAPSLAEWVVTFTVDKVTHGDFSKSTFSIRVHSPARSGLQIGEHYPVQAKWNGAGYDVDEFQWMKERK
ncbi:MAG TPA: hypothetical protein PLP17_10450 [Oligoflexia bacterium]|mgnify:CR=1 FL=1|nr:hypothetical protein [Oligoflexia bacterium]